MTADLALIAERRGGLAAMFGLLLVEEPGPGLAELVGDLPALAPLAGGDPAIRTAYERIFLRGVPLYESVFGNDDAQHGGDVLSRVVELYEQVGYREHAERRWRVAGADHLGLQLRCYALLCNDEADAWRGDVPDAAMAAVETERNFLADHLSAWAQVALIAVSSLAGETPYAALVDALGEFLREEHARLRPCASRGPHVEAPALPERLGPARLARLLLAPVTCGTWLGTEVIARSARSIGAPWRASDSRSSLRFVLESAAGTGDLAAALAPLAEAVHAAAASHARHSVTEPANEMTWRMWQSRAETMAELLHGIIGSGSLVSARAPATESFTVSGGDPALLADAVDAAVAQLRAQGLCVVRTRPPS